MTLRRSEDAREFPLCVTSILHSGNLIILCAQHFAEAEAADNVFAPGLPGITGDALIDGAEIVLKLWHQKHQFAGDIRAYVPSH